MFDARAAADPRAEALARFVYRRDGKDAARDARGGVSPPRALRFS